MIWFRNNFSVFKLLFSNYTILDNFFSQFKNDLFIFAGNQILCNLNDHRLQL